MLVCGSIKNRPRSNVTPSHKFGVTKWSACFGMNFKCPSRIELILILTPAQYKCKRRDSPTLHLSGFHTCRGLPNLNQHQNSLSLESDYDWTKPRTQMLLVASLCMLLTLQACSKTIICNYACIRQFMVYANLSLSDVTANYGLQQN